MTISEKKLTEQAWSLQLNLNRLIDARIIKRIASHAFPFRRIRLQAIQERAYSRYLRRLKQQWR